MPVTLHFLLQDQDGDSTSCQPFLMILLNSTDTFINNPYSKCFSINSMIVATISCQDPDRYKVWRPEVESTIMQHDYRVDI